MVRDDLRRAVWGRFFFRWRSYLPILLVLPLIVALPQSGWFETAFGPQAEIGWDIFSTLVSFAGLAIRIATVGFVPAGTSGRNAREQRATVLNTTGLYSVVRNPLYLGNVIILLGFLLAVKVWWLVLMALVAAAIFYGKVIRTEEDFLEDRFGPVYQAWRAVTPMIVPDFSLWRRPALPFSLRTVLRREYNGFYLIILALTAIELATDLVGEGISFADFVAEPENTYWLLLFGIGTLAWIGLRQMKKRTDWLDVDGRR